jgi:hypothetical protein
MPPRSPIVAAGVLFAGRRKNVAPRHATSVIDSSCGRYCVEYTPTPPLGNVAAQVAQPAGAPADE